MLHHWVDTSDEGLLVPRGYHPPSSQCFITGSIPLLVDYLVPEGIIHPVVSASSLC